MYDLSNLRPAEGSRRKRTRRGRGTAAGRGRTCGRGHKGQKARSGSNVTPGFEGGQMPIIRRLPKRGFTSPFKREYALVKLSDLAGFEAGSTIDRGSMVEAGLIKKVPKDGVKVLGNGEIGVALIVRAEKFTRSAKEKLAAAGGRAEEI